MSEFTQLAMDLDGTSIGSALRGMKTMSEPAMALDGTMIGSAVTFDWEMPGGGRTSCRVTGELRQISHSSGQTVLHLSSRVHDTGGEMDEFVLDPSTPIFLKEG